MSSSKTNARITGVLFILGTATGITAAGLLSSILSSPDLLAQVAASRVAVLAAALLVLFMGFSCAGIGISLYPVLKPHGEGVAVGVVGFRVVEGTLQAVSAVGLVALLAVSHEFVKAGSPEGSFYQPLGAAIKTVSDWMGNGFYLFPWCIAAFLYYGVFYQTKLVPRWLSVWGFVGLVLMLISTFLAVFGVFGHMSPAQGLMNLPIALQEMVLAGWLIVKGYQE